jgi:hypothetical protein
VTRTYTDLADVEALLPAPEIQSSVEGASLEMVPVTLPALTDVREADRIVAGDRVLEVVEVTAGHTYEIVRRVRATEVS